MAIKLPYKITDKAIRLVKKNLLSTVFIAALLTVVYQYFQYQQEKKEIVARTLNAIYTEMEVSYGLYQERTGKEIEKLERAHSSFEEKGMSIAPITLYFTVPRDFFPVYTENSSFLGYLDRDLSNKIIKGYALAHDMASVLRYHAILFDKSEKERDIYYERPDEVYKARFEAYRHLVIDHQKRIIERGKEFEAEIEKILKALRKEIEKPV